MAKILKLKNPFPNRGFLSKKKKNVTNPSINTTQTHGSEEVKTQSTENHKTVPDQPSSSNSIEISTWTSQLHASAVHGFDNELKLLVKMLQSEIEEGIGFKAIGVVGARGVGKSTLCKSLLDRPEVKNYEFFPRIWVSMSREFIEDPDPKIALVKRILICLGVENSIIDSIPIGEKLKGLLYALYLQLRGKKFLIVLDDAKKDTDNWYENLDSSLPDHTKLGEKLAYGLPKGYGGRVIVTSRYEEVTKKMVGDKNLRRLLPLTDPESCWKIYEQEFRKIESPLDPQIEKDESFSLDDEIEKDESSSLPHEIEKDESSSLPHEIEKDESSSLPHESEKKESSSSLDPETEKEGGSSLDNESTKKGGSSDTRIMKLLKKEVLHKSGGLPLAAKLMGQIQKEKGGPLNLPDGKDSKEEEIQKDDDFPLAADENEEIKLQQNQGEAANSEIQEEK